MTSEHFDRCPITREDADWVLAQAQSPSSSWLLFDAYSLRVAVNQDHGNPITAKSDGAEAPPARSHQDSVFLGRIGGQHYFARLATEADHCAGFQELRDLAAHLSPAWLEMLGMARSLLAWHRSHRHCGFCGSQTTAGFSGQVRRCSNQSCANEAFPRTDPAIIVLVHSGAQTLLVNKPSWPENRLSVVAGFVDPSETMEDATRREILEETSIETGAVRYLRSQGWPYPGSLMLACEAEALSTDIDVSPGQELRSADWYTREQIRSQLADGTISLPPVQAVSRWLIDYWLNN